MPPALGTIVALYLTRSGLIALTVTRYDFKNDSTYSMTGKYGASSGRWQNVGDAVTRCLAHRKGVTLASGTELRTLKTK